MSPKGIRLVQTFLLTSTFAAGWITSRSTSTRYEFHVGTGPAAGYTWRMDRRSGEVAVSYGTYGWHIVPNAEARSNTPEKFPFQLAAETNAPASSSTRLDATH